MNRRLRSTKKTLFRPFYQISVFYHFLAFLSHWRLRKTNRRLRSMKKTLFWAILSNFGFLSFFSIFESLAASENE